MRSEESKARESCLDSSLKSKKKKTRRDALGLESSIVSWMIEELDKNMSCPPGWNSWAATYLRILLPDPATNPDGEY
jgi:hypothetical protein